VLGAVGGVYEILLDDGRVVEAALRGRLKLEQRTGDRVVAGDRVQVAHHPDNHTIESVADRASQLARRAPGSGGRRAKVIVANAEQLVAVFAARDPQPHRRMLDRFLVLAEANALRALIVLNKTDLAEGDADDGPLAAYERAGYAVLYTSAKTGRGVAAVRDALCGATSVLAGPSGVGKSSLLNAVQPGLGLRVAGIGAALKGRHTTVTARIIPLDCGGWVADTPGLRELGLWRVDPAELRDHFPELRGHAEECRFGFDCSHVHEPACAVRAAVDRGDIDRERYESYVALVAGDDG
jgi:ribosome biogenesis GTPase